MTDLQWIVELGATTASEMTGTGSPIGSVVVGMGSPIGSVAAGKRWRISSHGPHHFH